MLLDEILYEDLGNPQNVYVGKNMDEKEAKNKAKKYATRDFRGVKYNKKTGYVTLT